jgi:hypothetical protein
MNDFFRFRRLVALLWVGFLVLLAGCSRPEAVRVELQTRGSANREILQLQVDALVSGPMTDLHYKWFAVSGTCSPQESAQPTTQFSFAEGVANDRITLEAWRGDRLVARAEKDLHFSNELAERAQAEGGAPDVFIEFTQIPPLEAGGDHTRGDIAGRVTGRIEPDYRVIVYARAYDSWYIQPTVRALHPIKSDKTWVTWTHTGESYAAFVVRADYVPLMRLDVLPPLGGNIKARVVTEGKK